ncbi:hypothetical protein PI124_g1674 [Phytophthora idaei]|nr:hypothetical protein PI124_g1674 [Phytophthora idaei]
MNFAGFVRGKAETKKWLTSCLNSGESVSTVAAKLGVFNTPAEKAILHQNWRALVKFQRMKLERTYGKKLSYAYFGTGYQTEKKTKECLLKWVMAGDSIESVAKTLGLVGLKSKMELIGHQNYKAFRTFVKWRKQWAEMRANGSTAS